MTRGPVSISVIIAMSLMCSFDGHSTAATGYFYEHPIRPYNPPTLSTLRSTDHYDAITAGSKVVTSPRPRVTVPPIPSLPPLTSRTTLKPTHTNKQPATTTEVRQKPAAIVYPRQTTQAQQNVAQKQKQNPQPTKMTQSQSTKPSQFQQQLRPPFSQAPVNTQHLYNRQQNSTLPTTSFPATSRAALKTTTKPLSNHTPKPVPKAIPKPSPKPLPNPTLKPTSKPTQRFPPASSTKFPVKTTPVPTQKQTPKIAQRSPLLPAPPLPKLPPNPALPQRPVAHATTTQRPTAMPAISRRWSLQKPVQVLNSRPIQASASSSLLQSPDIYVVNGRQLKQYKVYEQIDNDIEQDLGNFIPANFFLHSYHARIGPTHPLGEDVQLQSRFGNQRSAQQQSFQQAPTSIALGSGGLGFVRLPNGNVYLGSGSLGYISGLQRNQEVVQARTRTGAPAPDATHFGHGPLSDSFYYGSD